jgi:predicted RNA-binding Zn-ribbon protein involved in translation (DUF1610 family)
MKNGICNECGSNFISESSEMINLCKECSHILYNYEKCEHLFEKENCTKCGWNANRSVFMLKKVNKNKKLIEFVGSFLEKYSNFNFQIKDYWEADKNAIGLSNKNGNLAYIFINIENDYFLELENPSKNIDQPYEFVKNFKKLKKDALEKEILNHLK